MYYFCPMLTAEQKAILAFARSVGGPFTKAEAVKEFGREYYHNGSKHVGDRLSRMVNAGLLEREAKGRYKIGKCKKNKPATIDAGQTDLFG